MAIATFFGFNDETGKESAARSKPKVSSNSTETKKRGDKKIDTTPIRLLIKK